MDRNTISKIVHDIIINNNDIETLIIDDDASLKALGLSSIKAMELIAILEKHLKKEIDDSDLSFERIDSINLITQLVDKYSN